MKFYNIPEQIKELEFDGDKTDLRLYHRDNFRWNAETEEKYNEIVTAIDKNCVDREQYSVYCTYDGSGFDYWKDEGNYIIISITFHSEEFTGNIEELETDIYTVYSKCEDELQGHHE